MKKGIQVYNERSKMAEWAQKVSLCRESGQSVREWCQENRVNISSYYKWQRKLYFMAQAQQEMQFAEVTPLQSAYTVNVAVTVRVAGAEAAIHNGADAATIEAVLRVLKSC